MDVPESYDEQYELKEYFSRNWRRFMTVEERRAERLGLLREQAFEHSRDTVYSDEGQRLLNEYDAEIDKDVHQLIGADFVDTLGFRDRVFDRIKLGLETGAIEPYRCPKCRCILKTPEALQCLWCGYDWHAPT